MRRSRTPRHKDTRIRQESEGIAVERNFFEPGAGSDHRDDIKPVGVLAEIMLRYEFLGSPAQMLLLLPVHELPRIPVSPGGARFDLDEDQHSALECNEVQLARARTKPARENVVALPHEK